MGFRPFVVGIVLISLASFLALNFMTSFVTLNNPNSTLLINSTLGNYSTKLNDSLYTYQKTVNSTIGRLGGEDAKPSTFALFLIIPAALYIPLDFVILSISGVKTISDLFFTQFIGTGSTAASLVFVMFIAILSFTFAIYLIKFIRTGESER